MAKKKASVAIIEQINRKLAAKGQILTATRRLMRSRHDRGEYCILDLSGNVMDTHIDPEELARKLGVLKERREAERQIRN